MILFEKNDMLNESLHTARIHLVRMQFAYSRIRNYFPLSIDKYADISEDEMCFFDQFIYRFSKLQDVIGAKLFKSILINLGEDISAMPYIDIVLKLEKLKVIRSAEEWFQLREIRNLLTHEYPLNQQEVVDDLNLLFGRYQQLLDIWQQTDTYVLQKFSYLITER